MLFSMAVVYNILIAPAKAFQSIKQKPMWWQGLLLTAILISVANVLAVWGSYDYIYQLSLQHMGQLSPEQAEAAQKFMSLPVMVTTTGITTLITGIVAVFVQAGVFHLLTPLAGGETRFTRALGIVVWSKMAIVVGAWFTGLMSLITRVPFRADLGVFVGETSKLQAGLSQFELFSVWSLILVAEGMHRVSGCRRNMAYVVVFSAWVLWIIIRGGAGLLM